MINDFLKKIIKESKEIEYINSISIKEFSDLQQLSIFVKEANKNGLGVHLKNESSNFHQGILVQVYDINNCGCKEYLDK